MIEKSRLKLDLSIGITSVRPDSAFFTRHMDAFMLMVTRMTGERIKKERSTGIAHYVRLFALWVLLIALGLTAIHFERNGDDFGDYAYVLFTASLAVALLEQLWTLSHTATNEASTLRRRRNGICEEHATRPHASAAD